MEPLLRAGPHDPWEPCIYDATPGWDAWQHWSDQDTAAEDDYLSGDTTTGATPWW